MSARVSRYVQATVVAVAAVLTLGACSSSSGGSSDKSGAAGTTGASGTPVRGGSATVLEGTDPRSLDPGAMANTYAQESVIGNALYGELLTNDTKTGEVKYEIAQSLVDEDNGTTWTLKLKPGIVYSDGSPMGAADVKYNWEHMKDPATGSPHLGDAATIKGVDVVDDLTAKVTLVSPNAAFPYIVYASALNWVGKPAVTKQGQAAVDAHPIGAGPFVLQEWRRQDVIKLTRNAKYWDAPRPYLDSLQIRAVNDPTQRYNTLVSGGADVAADGDWQNYDKAKAAGLTTISIETAGGVGLVFNTTKAPFNDVRARQAVSYALDLDVVNDANTSGKAPVPTTMFWKDQKFYQDIPLHTYDKAKAQQLFDELAAEGKPVSFAVTIVSPAQKTLTDSVQTQLSTFKNVKMSTNLIDFAQYGSIVVANRNFEAITSSLADNRFWRVLNGKSGSNLGRINDPQLNAALDKTQVTTTSPAELDAAYKTIQERYVAVVPMVLYQRQNLGAMANKNVGGLESYGYGSVRPEMLWKK